MYKTVFWFLLVWTVFSLALQLIGYEILDSVIIVLVIDLMALGIIVEIGRKKPLKEINEKISSKIENIEKVCQSILDSAGENPIMGKIEERISKQKEDVNYLLDKMSRKALDLEERINKFGTSLAEHIEDFNERLEKLEEPKKEESFPVGETVYMEDDEEE
jgi:hypothetical protein